MASELSSYGGVKSDQLRNTSSRRHTHLPRSEFPVCRDAVRRVHVDFGDAQSFLDGLQLEPQQVKVNAASFKYLTRGDKTKKTM
ncbi:hypothetical protein EYF80_027967 [Liparis tanakae]|uniref:Uncharacterized protein n=1 Tax=Liparis tanakae TaxID=230148 RepID=A0A4Z2H8K2_9TELE|nr:hypothetical protein EYF80_027967 [Liparis tanakae]